MDDTGIDHCCTVDDIGVACWGLDASGQSSVPELLAPVWIGAGGAFSCAIDGVLGIVCWGDNTYGQVLAP